MERTLLDLDTLETTLSGAKQLTKNTAFFLSSEETEEADFQRNGSTNITAYLTDYVIEGYQAREVRNGNTISGTLFLHLPNYQISANNFTTTNTKYLVQPTFSNGSSNNTGTIGIFDTTTSFALEGGYLSIQDSYVTDNAIGFRGDFKNMTLFAQGENVGDATRKYGSELLINLGDPLLRNYDTNPNVYDTNYDGGLGVESFNDPTKTIFTVKPIDFNNDKLKDLLIVYTDGTVKLAKNYGHGVGQNFQSLENLLLIAVGIDEVFVGDIDNNHYEDIIIRTTTNQLRVYLNKDGKFDVDGYPVCLNTNVNPGEISTTPHLLSSVHQTFLEDMDKDGAIDILTNDHKGFVKIFYGGERNARPTYLSTNNVQCDPQRYERQKADTTIITRFGIKIDESSKIIDNSMVHWKNIEAEMPNMEDMNIDDPENVGVDMSNLSEDAINQMIEDLNNNPEDTDINQLSEML
ncbi:MAG: VCBS repeat-containing protein [Candidatus Peribacteria bacterium]|nr:VCBS repeat-containing protein [Candidatus Peribacteria bacterium]